MYTPNWSVHSIRVREVPDSLFHPAASYYINNTDHNDNSNVNNSLQTAVIYQQIVRNIQILVTNRAVQTVLVNGFL